LHFLSQNSVATLAADGFTDADRSDRSVPLAQLKRTPMNALALTTERIVALVIVALNILAAAFFSTVSPNPGLVAMAAFGLSLPGLAMIWFRDALSVTGFDRGVLRESPPIFIDVIGWLFLVILPVIFLYKLLP
jgi:hypothetical protein